MHLSIQEGGLPAPWGSNDPFRSVSPSRSGPGSSSCSASVPRAVWPENGKPAVSSRLYPPRRRSPNGRGSL